MRFQSVIWVSVLFLFILIFSVTLITATATSYSADNYTCSSLPSIGERVKCQLALPADKLGNYLPLECMNLDSVKRSECISSAGDFRSCAQFSTQAAKESCFLEKIAYPADLKSEITACQGIFYAKRGTCLTFLKEKAVQLALFRISDLENKAIELKDANIASEQLAYAFIANAELKKRDVWYSNNYDEKVKLIESVYADWQILTGTVKKSA